MILGLFLLITLFLAGMTSSDAQTPEDRIRAEGLQHSQVMEIALQITDGVGPRLTNSPGIRAAQARALADLKSWGVTGRPEEWSDFGRGWELTGLTAEQRAPAYGPLIAYAKAWSPAPGAWLKRSRFTSMPPMKPPSKAIVASWPDALCCLRRRKTFPLLPDQYGGAMTRCGNLSSGHSRRRSS